MAATATATAPQQLQLQLQLQLQRQLQLQQQLQQQLQLLDAEAAEKKGEAQRASVWHERVVGDEPGQLLLGNRRSGWLPVASRAAVPIKVFSRLVERRLYPATGFDPFDPSNPCPNCSNPVRRTARSRHDMLSREPDAEPDAASWRMIQAEFDSDVVARLRRVRVVTARDRRGARQDTARDRMTR